MPFHPIWLILFLPLAGVLINGLLGARLPRMAVAIIGCGVVGGAFLVALLVMRPIVDVLGTGQSYRDFTLYEWLGQDPGLVLVGHALSVPFAIRADPLSLMMVYVVTGVGFLIHVYSTGYMADDAHYPRFFTFLNLFTFAMLLLVLANNYLLMFVGWEGVGLCSYLLVGYYFEKPSAAFAAKKAFLVNRVGDFGFILGVILIFVTFGTLTYSTPQGNGVFDQVVADPEGRFASGAFILLAITGLLFLGATGKSAQLPLYMWLPDAMEGPTPVSALIHAATMVTAGVYMVARSNALFSRAPVTESWIAIIAVVTMLAAGLVALTQYDIKRVLAYSTVSQLGYMFVGVGVGAYTAGAFHLVTHAFFKACLFLGAGSVMHALSGELDMRKMGGLWRRMPATHWTFLASTLAISGFVLTSGFYSKDAIIHAAMGYNSTIGWLTLAGALLTALYMGRLYVTTFWGPMRFEPGTETAASHAHVHSEEHGHGQGPAHAHGHSAEPHESPPSMTVPLVILAVLAILGGLWLGWQLWPPPEVPRVLGPFLMPSFTTAAEATAHGEVGHWLPFASILACFGGLGLAFLGFRSGRFARGWGDAWPARIIDARLGYDWLLHLVFVRFGTFLCNMLAAVADQMVIDGIVNGVARTVGGAAGLLRQLQTGFVRNYALVVLTGAVFVIILLMWTVQAH